MSLKSFACGKNRNCNDKQEEKTNMKRLWILVLVNAVSLIMIGCDDTPKQVGFEKVNTPENLANQSKEFKKGVIKVTEGVHVAVGYCACQFNPD